jgi:hypothetical protein
MGAGVVTTRCGGTYGDGDGDGKKSSVCIEVVAATSCRCGLRYLVIMRPDRLGSQQFSPETWIEKFNRHLVLGVSDRVAICGHTGSTDCVHSTSIHGNASGTGQVYYSSPRPPLFL